MSLLRLRPVVRAIPQTRNFLNTTPCQAKDSYAGRGPEEHVTNQNHQHNIHAEASNKGQQARAEDTADSTGSTSTHKQSGATSQKPTDASKQAEAEHGRKDRGMGLQDERGGKGH